VSARLVILGILRGEPLHGYEIKQIIEHRMGDWASIAFGSIYFALAKLTEEAMIEKLAVTREGKRPSRSVFQITKAGEAEFLRLLRGCWENIERQRFSIDVGIAFMDALPAQEIPKHLRYRLAKLEEVQEHLVRHEDEQLKNPHVPAMARFIFSHSLLHNRAELEWTRDLLSRMENGMM